MKSSVNMMLHLRGPLVHHALLLLHYLHALLQLMVDLDQHLLSGQVDVHSSLHRHLVHVLHLDL